MIVERNKDEIVFRVSAGTDVDDLQDFMEILEFKELVKDSKAMQKQVDRLVRTVKKGRWQRTKKDVGM